MTDKNLASLSPIELIGMLNISRARLARSKDNNERARLFEQQIEIVRAMRTIQDALQYQIDQLNNSGEKTAQAVFFFGTRAANTPQTFLKKVLALDSMFNYTIVVTQGANPKELTMFKNSTMAKWYDVVEVMAWIVYAATFIWFLLTDSNVAVNANLLAAALAFPMQIYRAYWDLQKL